MNLEKYTIAEEGILSKLKEKFSSKKKPVTKPSKDDTFDIQSIPKNILDKEIALRKKEYLDCVNFFNNVFKNKKKYFNDSRFLKNIEIYISTRESKYEDNYYTSGYPYFNRLTKYDNSYSLWANISDISVAFIGFDININQDDNDEIIDVFADGKDEICSEFEDYLQRKKFKCIKDYTSTAWHDGSTFSLDMGPSEEFLNKIKEYKNTTAQEGIFNTIKTKGSQLYKKIEDYDRKKHPYRYETIDSIRKSEEERKERERREEDDENTRTDVYEYSKGVFAEAFKQANFSMTVPSKFKNSNIFKDDDFWDFVVKDTINAVKKFINTKAYTDEIKRFVEYHNSHKEGDIPYDDSLPDKISVNWWKKEFQPDVDDAEYYIWFCAQDFAMNYGMDVLDYVGDNYISKKYGISVNYGDYDEGCIYFK